ncbi:MAG: PD40 domain-containing protein, partial [Candidatus Tectomicrobia bacterium]|nr:PD40 domain-containing protein [Candidatus Tectomicrobia bacterium]
LIGLSGCRGPDEFNNGGQPTVAPTSSMPQLAFAGNRNGKYALFVINIDGSGEKQITTWPEDDYDHPSWSPDGILIAAQRLHAGVRIKWSIVTINLNNGTLKDLTGIDDIVSPSFYSPVFSPYGNLIIFNGLQTVNLGGVVGSISVSQPGKLGNNDMYLAIMAANNASNPSVSPDASKIAFEAGVAVVAPPKPSPTPTITKPTPTPTITSGLVGGGAGISSGAQLRGDPSQYKSDPTQKGELEPGKRISVVDFEGTNLRQLTTSKEKYDDTYPSWSPDGKRIAFMSNRTGKNQIYVMNADGSGQTQITNDNFNNHDPAWSPDGAYIAYVADHSGVSELVVIRPDGAGRTRVNRIAEMVKNPAWRLIPGKTLGGLEPPHPTPVNATPPATTNPPVTTTSPQTPAPTIGGLFISVGGTNSPYSIYVNGALVGKDSANLTLVPGSYRVTINNRNGTRVYDQMSTVIAGKTSQVKLSGKG